MLTINDIQYIYQLIERANVQGAEAQKVVDLKMKIIGVLKAAQEVVPTPTPGVSDSVNAPEGTTETPSVDPATAMSSEAEASKTA